MQKLNLSKLLFFLSVFTLSLGQFAKLYDSRGVVLYAFDLVVGIYAVYSLIYLLIVKKSFVISKQFILFLLFSLVAVFSLLINITTLSATETISSSAYLIRWLIYLVAGMCTFNLIKKDISIFKEKH